jgi:hypothetical protein
MIGVEAENGDLRILFSISFNLFSFYFGPSSFIHFVVLFYCDRLCHGSGFVCNMLRFLLVFSLFHSVLPFVRMLFSLLVGCRYLSFLSVRVGHRTEQSRTIPYRTMFTFGNNQGLSSPVAENKFFQNRRLPIVMSMMAS